MGQGISCNNEEQTKIDLNNHHQYSSPIRNRYNQHDQQLQYQNQENTKGLPSNQFNNLSTFSLSNPSSKQINQLYDHKIDHQQTPSLSQTIISEQKLITHEDSQLNQNLFFNGQEMKYDQNKKDERNILQDITTAPQSARKQLQRPSSNCKLSTRVKEKIIDNDEDEQYLGLNFSPSKPFIPSKISDQGSILQDINQQPKRLGRDSRNPSSHYSHNQPITSSNNEKGFRYLQSGINQLEQDQNLKGSIVQDQSLRNSTIVKPPLLLQQSQSQYHLHQQNQSQPLVYTSHMQYKSSKQSYHQVQEENKGSKRYADDKENLCEDELYHYQYKPNQRNEMLNNLEKFKNLHLKSSPIPITVVEEDTKIIQKPVEIERQNNFDIYKVQDQNKYSKNKSITQYRSKSHKRNEVSSNQRSIPTKQFKEDEVIKNKSKTSKSKSKKPHRKHYSSSSSSESSSFSKSLSSQNSISSNDSCYNSKKNIKQNKHKSRKHDNDNAMKRNKSNKKGKHQQQKQKQITEIINNEEYYQQNQSIHNSNYNSIQQPQQQQQQQWRNSHQIQQFNNTTNEEIQRISSRSTVVTACQNQHLNSNCQNMLQNNQKSCNNQYCQNIHCASNNLNSYKEIQSTNSCQSCVNCNQTVSSRQNTQHHHQHNHLSPNNILNHLPSPYESNNPINRNQSNISMHQNSINNNNSLLMNNQLIQMRNTERQNQQCEQQQQQYKSSEQQLQEIQQQLLQQQLALVQTQQTHQSHIQNILLQHQQQNQLQHSGIPLITPQYNLVYSQNSQGYGQNKINQSHVIGNYINQQQQQLNSPNLKQNGMLPIYYPNVVGQNYILPQHSNNSGVIQNNQQEQVIEYLDKNQVNIYHQQQQLNAIYPQLTTNQYLIHPQSNNLSQQQQQYPIIINNNLLSPNKDQQDQRNKIKQKQDGSDDKLKNLQSLSFNINSSQSDDNKIRDYNKNNLRQNQETNHHNKILESSISDYDRQRNSQKNNNQKQNTFKDQLNNQGVQQKKDSLFSKNNNNVNNQDEDYHDNNNNSFDEMESSIRMNGKQNNNDTNANKPLSKQTKNNINHHSIHEHLQNKKQPNFNSNFDEQIRNTNIAQDNNIEESSTLLEINFSSNQNNITQTTKNDNKSKSLAEIFQEKKKKLAQKMQDQKKGLNKTEDKPEQQIELSNNKNINLQQEDDFTQLNSVQNIKNNQQGKRSKDEIIKLRQEMKEYGNRVNPKLKARTQQKQQAEQEQINHDNINSNNRMKSPVYSKQKEEMMIRLAQGIKPKITEKEMYALTKKNYDNLPEVKKKRQEQEKQINKQELLKIKQEKLKELDEKRRGKYKQKISCQSSSMNKTLLNNNSSQMMINNQSELINYNRNDNNHSLINNNNNQYNSNYNNQLNNNSNQYNNNESINQLNNYSSIQQQQQQQYNNQMNQSNSNYQIGFSYAMN